MNKSAWTWEARAREQTLAKRVRMITHTHTHTVKSVRACICMCVSEREGLSIIYGPQASKNGRKQRSRQRMQRAHWINVCLYCRLSMKIAKILVCMCACVCVCTKTTLTSADKRQRPERNLLFSLLFASANDNVENSRRQIMLGLGY